LTYTEIEAGTQACSVTYHKLDPVRKSIIHSEVGTSTPLLTHLTASQHVRLMMTCGT